ncbi:hypothetical protein [Chromobacterium sp. Panama]|uniref:hypothetical protein n=1 Tax=Chromobacterium sp. Panama TaxID=2161826 RepID=UPI0011B29785|nr:hypothetical protein [Chromobacterium sp. Panama]
MENCVLVSGFDKEVEISCCFAMVSGGGFLVESKEDAFSMKNAIKIQHLDLEKILFSLVPALGGSEFSYLCDASIIGTLRKSEDVKFQGEIVDIKKFNLIVSGLCFNIF